MPWHGGRSGCWAPASGPAVAPHTYLPTGENIPGRPGTVPPNFLQFSSFLEKNFYLAPLDT